MQYTVQRDTSADDLFTFDILEEEVRGEPRIFCTVYNRADAVVLCNFLNTPQAQEALGNAYLDLL